MLFEASFCPREALSDVSKSLNEPSPFPLSVKLKFQHYYYSHSCLLFWADIILATKALLLYLGIYSKILNEGQLMYFIVYNLAIVYDIPYDLCLHRPTFYI